MAEQYRVAVIGAGRPWRTEGSTGFGMSHVHVHGYEKTGKCRLVAVADIQCGARKATNFVTSPCQFGA